jgi:hypothetical protein
MIFKVLIVQPHDPTMTISIRCPSCRQRGTFESVNVHDLFNDTQEQFQFKNEAGDVTREVLITRFFGQRRCPNPKCRAHIFFVYEPHLERLLVTYPAERVDFDATNIPEAVLKSLEEAITCHANRCYVASAIMVRKTMEELCHHQEAKGDNLKARIKELKTKVILPEELLTALDELRLLGNDAAHIESQTFNEVGQRRSRTEY